MALKLLDLFFYVCIVNLIQLSPFAHSRKPKILSEYETIVASGQNWTILCQGNTPLLWKWPEVKNETFKQWTKISMSSVIPRDNDYTYASRLFVQNVTYPFTGFYTCFEKFGNEFDVTQVYLYVRDEENLAVNEQDIDTVIVTQYSDAIIPCRPTSPDVQVELTLVTGEKNPKVFLDTITEEGTIYRYHPHYGFITNHTAIPEPYLFLCSFSRDFHHFECTVIVDIEYNATFDPKTGFEFFVDHLRHEGLYYCTFIYGNITYEQSYYVKVAPIAESIPKPYLEEISGGHTIVGESLVLNCTVQTSNHIFIEWTTPSGPLDRNRMLVSKQMRKHDTVTCQQLTIKNATLKDKGEYFCHVMDNQNHTSVNSLNVTIYDIGEHFINLTEENGVYELSEIAGAASVQWRIDVQGHPEPKLSWLNNMEEAIPLGETTKYFTKFSSKEALLKIKDIAITDFGNYTLVAENQYQTKTLMLFLNVTDKPSVHIETEDFHIVNQASTVKCIAAAYPIPHIYWSFKPCQDNSCSFQQVNESYSEQKGSQLVSYASIQSSTSGLIKCMAINSIGYDKIIQGFYVSDVENGFDIFGYKDTVNFNEETKEAIIAVEEKFRMTCAASVYNYTEKIQWLYNGNILTNQNSNYTLEKSHTEYTHRLSLEIPNIGYADGGLYSCLVYTKNGLTKEFKNISLVVSEPVAPVINATNIKGNVEMALPNRVEFSCPTWGIPKPRIIWFKNDVEFQPPLRIKMKEENQRLSFYSTEGNDEGVYKCVASNKIGSAFREFNLKFKNKPKTYNQLLVGIIIFLLAGVVALAIFTGLKIRNAKKYKKELKIAGLANFENGALENFNPDLGIDDQAELLPYDKSYEFPIAKLKLGKQLGSGAFGVVMKGEAKGIVEGEDVTTVAVKMVKKNAEHNYIKALASELKIMVHLGQHLNVVNLLGACTKNVTKRELLVIVEYCRFGNLQNYLLRHRELFIDQVNPKTGHLDYTIGQEILERTYSVSSNQSNNPSSMKYAASHFSNSSGTSPHVPHEMGDYRENYYGTTAKTDVTTVSMGEDGVVLSNNSVQPAWRSNYRGDYNKGNVKPICTKDLLAWAFQVSRGMEYLAARRVLHGDLAARNVLLADNNVVKICDFGLAKTMYKDDNYKKESDGPLPVKWMAIESIRDKVFSTQSDVWSFGIVLWEFFSLARTPYPGMEADERLYNKLADGYRMESPEYAPKEIYKMMLDCWQAKPTQRPSFPKLAERIGSMLEDTVRKHYIDLNDPYLVMNTQRLEDGRSDYLAMLTPPNFENLSSPHHYANDLPNKEDTSGYLCMKPSIFSPRAEDERIFDFEINPKAREGELMPMLGHQSESDNDSSVCNSPLSPNSFSNPSYHLPPIVENEQVCEVKFPDNYINMLQSKNPLKDTNPFINKSDIDPKDNTYVNSNSRDWSSVKV